MDPNRETAVCCENHEDVNVTSWVSVCPRGLWRVQLKETHKSTSSHDPASHQSPCLGSLCHVRVQLNTPTERGSVSDEGKQKSLQPGHSVNETTEDIAVPFTRCLSAVLQVPLGKWTTVTLGEGQCDITEACLEQMNTGGKWEIQLSPLEAGSEVPEDSDQSLCATVELQTFTPGKESWELSPGEKMDWVKSHKERGGVRFRSGDVWGAADSYSRALKLLITLYGQVKELRKAERQEEEEGMPLSTDCPLASLNEYKTIKAELHSNLSLCQLKLKQPECARASAAKATDLEPGGPKAWYRLGQACQMVNELEEAKKAFKKLLEVQPDSSAAIKALKDVAIKEKETNKELGHRLSKMFS